MKRILQILLLTAALPLAAGCALESGSGSDGSDSQSGSTQVVGDGDEQTNGSTGHGATIVAEPNKGPSNTSTPITEDPNGGNQGPQPEPWVPPLSIRSESASSNGSSAKNK